MVRPRSATARREPRPNPSRRTNKNTPASAGVFLVLARLFKLFEYVRIVLSYPLLDVGVAGLEFGNNALVGFRIYF